MRPTRLLTLAVLATLLAAGVAPAQPATFTYQFALPGGAPSNTFTIPIGQTTADVQLYLQETSATTVLRTVGLAGLGGQILYNNPSGVAAVAAATDITNNPAFEVVFTRTADATTATLVESTFSTTGVQSPVADPLRVLVGTFRLTRLQEGPATLTLTARDRPGSSDTTRNDDGTAIDGSISSSTASLTVVGIPEPSSMMLCGLAAVGLAAFRRRSRRQATETTETVTEEIKA